MAVTLQELLNSNDPLTLAGTELNALASNGVVLATNPFSNVQGDSAGLGYPYGTLQLILAAPAGAWAGSIYAWFLSNEGDGYETYASTSPSATAPITSRGPDAIWTPEADALAKIKKCLVQPPICAANKILIWNNSGQAFAAAGNSIKLRLFTDQGN